MSIGKNIQKARKIAHISQKELGEILGVSASMIGQYENDLRRPKFETVTKIADALHVNPADLDESLIINLGSSVMFEMPDGESISIDSDSPLGAAATILHGLNEDGQKEWIKRGKELTEIPKYRK